ncbi:MAG: hypothetical protein PHQ49_05450 [Clostridia bacterium]|jgi:hypothetical protein|nr:hypothetical protein [Clostridia bacterium]
MLISMVFLMAACTEKTDSFKQQQNTEQEANATFLENVVNMRGNIKITPALRKSFNEFAKAYCWVYLPDMDSYESFFESTHYADSYGYPNFADAVFYVLKYLDVQNKISEDDMQTAVSALFAAKNKYEPMIHQNYPKFAKYENGYYLPWPEGERDSNRVFTVYHN